MKSDAIIYKLTQNPKDILIVSDSRENKAEIAKARAKLHRTTDGFVLNYRTVLNKLHIWRS